MNMCIFISKCLFVPAFIVAEKTQLLCQYYLALRIVDVLDKIKITIIN